jgi:polar amino acid transport system substrate-binding protein
LKNRKKLKCAVKRVIFTIFSAFFIFAIDKREKIVYNSNRFTKLKQNKRRKQKMKKIISLILAVAMMLSCAIALSSCGGGNTDGDLAAVKAAGKLVVGITDYAPMDYKDENGKWIGFDAELAEQFAASLGVDCEFFVIADWNNKVADINAKEIDLIWNGMTASDELGTKIDFSTAYAKNAQVVVVKKGSTLTKDDLGNASIAAENGSAGASVAEETIKPKTLNKLPK